MDLHFFYMVGCVVAIYCPYSMPITFLPNYAKAININTSTIGLILSFFALGQFISSTFAGSYMKNWDKKATLLSCFTLLIMSLIMFSFLDQIKSSGMFILIGLTARFLQGVCLGIICSIHFSSIPYLYPESVHQKLYGYLEVGISFGISSGPLVGAFFYSFSFSFVFLAFAVIVLCFLIITYKFIDYNRNSKQKSLPNTEESEPLSYQKLFSNRRMVMTYFLFLISTSTTTFFFAGYAIDCRESFGLGEIQASLLYSILMALYFCACLVTDKLLVKTIDRRIFLMFGTLGQLTSLLMIGGSLFFPKNIGILVLGLIFLGCSTFFAVIPSIPEFIEIGTLIFDDREAVSNIASGLYNGVWGLAEFTGPYLGGFLTDVFTYSGSFTFFFFFGVVYIILFIIFGEGQQALRKYRLSERKTPEEIEINEMFLSARPS